MISVDLARAVCSRSSPRIWDDIWGEKTTLNRENLKYNFLNASFIPENCSQKRRDEFGMNVAQTDMKRKNPGPWGPLDPQILSSY